MCLLAFRELKGDSPTYHAFAIHDADNRFGVGLKYTSIKEFNHPSNADMNQRPRSSMTLF